MDIATMFDVISMIKELHDGKDENVYIEDYVFKSDGKTIYVLLSNGTSYEFAVM